jgi:hypothetical protein
VETQEVGVAYHLAFAEGRDGWCLRYITPCSEGEAGDGGPPMFCFHRPN